MRPASISLRRRDDRQQLPMERFALRPERSPLVLLTDASCLLAGYVSRAMANRFGVLLHPDDVRWAATEGVSETVIAAALLLHERSVDEIVPKLSAAELEQVIVLVGRNPRLYPRGILEALNQHGNLLAPTPPAESFPPDAAAKEQTTGADRLHPRHAPYGQSGAGVPQNTSERTSSPLPSSSPTLTKCA